MKMCLRCFVVFSALAACVMNAWAAETNSGVQPMGVARDAGRAEAGQEKRMGRLS